MKILSWMQTKLYRGQERQKQRLNSSPIQCTPQLDNRKEEFSDWPETLLAIGTFGNKKAKDDSSLDDITIEEVTKLTEELAELLSGKDAAERACSQPSDRFHRTARLKNCAELSPDAQVVLNKAKELLVDNRGGIRERSLSFLLKKMFVCHSGFSPAPSFKDPFTESRTDKILRTLFHKKVYPHSTLQPLAKKMLEKQSSKKKLLEEKSDELQEQSKWVKTDSEYIVLEI